MNTKKLVRAALIAAMYAVMTLILQPISFGAVQCRVSEALMLLPLLLPESVGGLTVGCLIANVLCGAALPDVVFGTLATLLAACAVRLLRNKPLLAAFMPVLSNGLIVGAVVYFCYVHAPGSAYSFGAMLACMGSVSVGEAVACALGVLLVDKVIRRVLPKDRAQHS